MAIWFIPETCGAIEVSYLAYYLCRITITDYSSWYVSGDHASSAYYTVLTDNDPGKNGAINAYLSSLVNTRASHTLKGIRTTWMNIISQCYSRSQKSTILYNSELSNIDFAVDLNIVANFATVVNDRTIPDPEVISYIIFFSDDYVMTGFQIAANAATTIDNTTFTNVSSRANG
jgi:hypothetical protein